MTEIVRVHGSVKLPSIVWPADTLAQRFAMEHPEPCYGIGVCECSTWESRCAELLAKANGWGITRAWPRTFGGLDFRRVVVRAIDHYSLFHKRGSRQVTAIVSHDYNRPDFAHLGDKIVVDRLPRSWYWRGGADATTAFLLRAVSP